MSLRSRQLGALCEKQVVTFAAVHLDARPTQVTGQLKTQKTAMSETSEVKGPASYFPSIEKTHAEPISHWMGILNQAGELKHIKLVRLLKTKHKLGHGHANASVAHSFTDSPGPVVVVIDGKNLW